MSDIVSFVDAHDDLKFTTEAKTKVLCISTKHEMPAKIEIVKGYINGTKYTKTRDWYNADFTKYEPYIVEYKKNPKKKLYCNLTRSAINKIPSEVENHVKSKRYQRLLQQRKMQEAEKAEEEEVEGDGFNPTAIDAMLNSEEEQEEEDETEIIRKRPRKEEDAPADSQVELDRKGNPLKKRKVAVQEDENESEEEDEEEDEDEDEEDDDDEDDDDDDEE